MGGTLRSCEDLKKIREIGNTDSGEGDVLWQEKALGSIGHALKSEVLG